MTDEVLTPLGARVRVVPAPEHLGPGVLMELSMVDPTDSRRAEVYLDPDSKRQLREILDD